MITPIAVVLVACVSLTLGAGVAALWSSRARRVRERRRALPQADRGLDEREAALQQRQQSLDAGERFRNRLVSKLSHDMRTPLNSIITLSQLMHDGSTGPLSSDQRKYAEVIHRSGQSLLALINDVLDLSHIETGRMDLDLIAVDVGSLIRGAGVACGELARAKEIALRLTPPPAAMAVRADPGRLRQVLKTLLGHAIRRSTGGAVTLFTDADDLRVTIHINDDGGSPVDLARTGREALSESLVAERDGTAPEPGLILADRLVTLMGGTILVDSAPDRGTTLSVALPRTQSDALDPVRDAPHTGEEAAAATPSGAASSVANGAPAPAAEQATARHGATPAHILLIEDDAIERDRIASLLMDAGYRVSPASSGQEGLNQLRAGRFGGVVLDLVMPGMTGLDVLRAVRSDERLATIPFVVLSALYMTKSEREVLGPSVAAVVRKGEGTGDELLVHLARALAGQMMSPPDAPRIGGDGGTGASATTVADDRVARVLVVEEDDDNLLAIEQVLASLPVRIETAATGQQAIEICMRQPPDLIVMDVELPGLSGLDVSAQIRRIPDCADIPIIALAASWVEGRRALGASCSGYLSKPVDPGQVVSAVTRALQLEIH